MPRETVIGNGHMAIAFDGKMSIRDFFYPRVGLENHVSGHEMRTGVWMDGEFSWIGNDWDIDIRYMPETLVSRCVARHPALKIRLETNDAVHHSMDVFLRKMLVHNASERDRKLRIFFTHDLHIYGDAIGDTVMYQSDLGSITHYKRKRYFLISGMTSQGEDIHQFATGYKESLGREGTWRDAEDGVLGGNPIAQGSVDSTVSFELQLPPDVWGFIYYWIACGKSLKEVTDLNAQIRSSGVDQLLLETENYWSAWVNKKEINLCTLPKEIIRAYKNSLLIMRSHADHGGGIIASCDSDILQFNRDTYSYVWMRDGAIAAMAFDLAGFREVSMRFFQFCNRVITDEGYFHHKYSSDGSVGSSWLAFPSARGQLPIEEDETALVLYALWRHFQRYRDVEFIESVYPNLVLKTTDFLLDYIDSETGLPMVSFDLWEENMGVFTWTAATVYAALLAAAKFARVFFHHERHERLIRAAANLKAAMQKLLYDPQKRRFIRAIYPDGSRDMTVDSSISGVFLYGAFNATDRVVVETMGSIKDRLWAGNGVGGIARYENDPYQRISGDVRGNPWFICTLWLARWQIARAATIEQLKEGLDLIYWVARHSRPSGVLAEQINPFTGEPVSVSPLVWSHAEFVIAVCEYLEKYNELASLVASPEGGIACT